MTTSPQSDKLELDLQLVVEYALNGTSPELLEDYLNHLIVRADQEGLFTCDTQAKVLSTFISVDTVEDRHGQGLRRRLHEELCRTHDLEAVLRQVWGYLHELETTIADKEHSRMIAEHTATIERVLCSGQSAKPSPPPTVLIQLRIHKGIYQESRYPIRHVTPLGRIISPECPKARDQGFNVRGLHQFRALFKGEWRHEQRVFEDFETYLTDRDSYEYRRAIFLKRYQKSTGKIPQVPSEYRP
jgi:hypothetical protein